MRRLTLVDQDGTREIVALTSRERQVLLLLLRGYQNKLISHELTIAEGTVKRHIAAMSERARATNRLELLIWGAQNPAAFAGSGVPAGLHEPDCGCHAYCRVVRDAIEADQRAEA